MSQATRNSSGAGLFISFEGLDGSGKTTQLRLLGDALRADGHRVITLRQPGGTPLGDRIRSILLNSGSDADLGAIAPEAELALMFADRAQSLREVIVPGLADGSVVLCDRYTDSSEAYQGAGRGLGSDRVLALHQALCNNLQPDLTILLLPPLATALRRARSRNDRHLRQMGADENRFEAESNEFYARVYDQYLEIARRNADRLVVFRGEDSIATIQRLILDVVRERLAAAGRTGVP